MVVDGMTEWSGAEVAGKPRLEGGLWVWKEGCHRGEYANVLLAAKGPCDRVPCVLCEQCITVATRRVCELNSVTYNCQTL